MVGVHLCAAASVYAVDYPIAIHRGNGLANVFAKLSSGQSARIAYMGGSVTQNPGWRDNVTAWFNGLYPGRITEINAGWGGTGSLIGAMRIGRDVLAQTPDLIFIEFAVNDLPEDPLQFVERNCEGMVRQAWSQSTATDVCFVETIAWYSEQPYLSGYYPTSVQAHYNVCDRYGCSSVNVGWALYRQVLSGTPWTSLAPDRVHPNAAGSKTYADAVIAYLESERAREGTASNHSVPVALTDFPVMSGTITALSGLGPPPSGWSVHLNEFGVSSFVQTSTPGATITVPFTGPAAACGIIMSPDGGNISYSVDGGAYASGNVPLAGPATWAFPVAKMLTGATHYLSLRAESGVIRIINIEAAQTGSVCGLDPADDNVALQAIATADTTYGPGWEPAKAIDGATSTKWTSTAGTAEHWLALDLRRVMALSTVVVKHAETGGEPAAYNTTAFRVETANTPAEPWTLQFTGDNAAQASSTRFCTSTPLLARYVRLYVTDAGIDQYARIPEFEVWGRPARARMDFDGDDDVDQSDFGHLQACLTGPGMAQIAPHCMDAKLDGDVDVDAADYDLFAACVGGAGHSPPVSCY